MGDDEAVGVAAMNKKVLLVGIESTNQIFLPAVGEGETGYTVRGRRITCTENDSNGRPLGGDWVMSVYAVRNRFPIVIGDVP